MARTASSPRNESAPQSGGTPAPTLSPELFAKIRGIQIRAQRLVTDLFAGEYESAFKGRGMEFEEVREYQPGDDLRPIDWNVTARMDHPYVKQHREERELTVMLLVDTSASTDFGTAGKLKSEVAAEVAALLAYTAIKSHDRVGLIAFSDQVELYIPPKKGRGHVWRVIRAILTLEPSHRGTDLAAALDYLGRVSRRRAVAFLISDFWDGGFDDRLRVAARRHDLTAIPVLDRREAELPPVGHRRAAGRRDRRGGVARHLRSQGGGRLRGARAPRARRSAPSCCAPAASARSSCGPTSPTSTPSSATSARASGGGGGGGEAGASRGRRRGVALLVGCGQERRGGEAALQGRAEATATIDREDVAFGDDLTLTLEVRSDPAFEIELPRTTEVDGLPPGRLRQHPLGVGRRADRAAVAPPARRARRPADAPRVRGALSAGAGGRLGSRRDRRRDGEAAPALTGRRSRPRRSRSRCARSCRRAISRRQIREIKPLQPIDRARPWLWIAGAIALVLAAGGGARVLAGRRVARRTRRRRRRRRCPRTRSRWRRSTAWPPSEPVGDAAVRRYYFALSEIVRAYIEGRFGLNATDLTSEEIVASLDRLDLPDERTPSACARSSPTPTRVKFAAHRPQRAEIGAVLDWARRFVEATRPVEPAPGSSSRRRRRRRELAHPGGAG